MKSLIVDLQQYVSSTLLYSECVDPKEGTGAKGTGNCGTTAPYQSSKGTGTARVTPS
jgi:hypothetical protein